MLLPYSKKNKDITNNIFYNFKYDDLIHLLQYAILHVVVNAVTTYKNHHPRLA